MKTFLRVAAVVVALVVGAAVAVPVNAEQFTAQIQLAFQQLGIWPYNGSYGNGEVPTWSTAANAFVAASGGGGLQTDINIAEVGGNAVGATVPVSGTLTVNAGTGFSDDATQGGALSATGPQVMLQATGTYVASVSSGVPARMVGGLDQIIISRPHAHVGDFVKGLAAVTDGSSTSLVAAQGAGIRFCATTILISNSSSDNYNNNSYWLNNSVVTTILGSDHGDIFQQNSTSLGTAFNLAEANFFVGASTAIDEHGVLLQDQNADGSAQCSLTTCGVQTENMWRRNVWHDFNGPVGGGGDTSVSTGTQNTRLVHETMVQNVRDTAGDPGYGVVVRNSTGTPQGLNNSFYFNNLAYDNWDPDAETSLSVFFVQNAPDAEWTAANYNLAFKPSVTLTFAANWSGQANEQSNVDPALVDVASDDFHLGPTSGAIGTAGPLTVTSGSGTGTTFNVAAGGGGFFRGPNTDIAQYGGNLTEGDVITVGTDTVTVVSVSTDAITVTPSFTWADAEPVYWGSDTTPDIGAFPYKADGYTLSATYSGGATKTINPNDASLVRWVVCFNDSVPYTVDNASPYTCAEPSGAFSARAYPLYASTTLWAQASEANGPVRLRRAP